MNLKPLTVLFLSTGNAARSLIAETLLNAKGSHRFTARSAGFQPAQEAHPETLALLDAENLPTIGLHTKGWGEFYAASHVVKIDVIVTLSEESRANCPPQWPGNPIKVHWIVDDPLGALRPDQREWKFRKCFTTLEARLNALTRSRLAPSADELFLQLKDIGMVV